MKTIQRFQSVSLCALLALTACGGSKSNNGSSKNNAVTETCSIETQIQTVIRDNALEEITPEQFRQVMNSAAAWKLSASVISANMKTQPSGDFGISAAAFFDEGNPNPQSEISCAYAQSADGQAKSFDMPLLSVGTQFLPAQEKVIPGQELTLTIPMPLTVGETSRVKAQFSTETDMEEWTKLVTSLKSAQAFANYANEQEPGCQAKYQFYRSADSAQLVATAFGNCSGTEQGVPYSHTSRILMGFERQ